jgi:hypothetical protein
MNKTELIFRYSVIYEQTLAKLSGEAFDDSKTNAGYKFAADYTQYWKNYNDKIFAYYGSFGLNLADFWMVYFVYPKKNLVPFSDPLTAIIKDDLEDVTATMVHELCHVLMEYYSNMEIWKKLYNHVQSKYGSEDFTTKAHIIVNTLAAYGLIEIYGKEKALELLSREKNYPGLKRAWEILDQKADILNLSNPIQAILSL